MATVIIKSDERRAQEDRVARSFAVGKGDRAGREKAELIAARSREAYAKLKRMEEHRR